jgi:tryptophanase
MALRAPGLDWRAALHEEPPVLRFFFGRLQPVDGWVENLAAAFRAEFGADC